MSKPQIIKDFEKGLVGIDEVSDELMDFSRELVASDKKLHKAQQELERLREAMNNIQEYSSMIPLHYDEHIDHHIKHFIEQIINWSKPQPPEPEHE